jgi:coenzyme F420 hydrogenase subunit beta
MVAQSRSLKRITSANLCVGCGLCASLSEGALHMKMSGDGYLRPEQTGPLRPDIDRLITDICPGARLTQSVEEGDDHQLWGPIVSVRAGASTDSALRHHAASGGALSAILLHLLETGQVDRAVETAASDIYPLTNMTVTSLDRADVLRAAGSRYAPSAPLSRLMSELEEPGKFALVGKPCDIAAARALARSDARIEKKIPFMISFFCAGVPSIHGAHAILEKLGVNEAEVSRFRYRGEGWPGRATAILKDRTKKSLSYMESWGDILSKRVQFRCKICPDGTGGFADVVCADAWYGDEKGYPLFEEQEGRSLIIARTASGENLIRSALLAGSIRAEPLNIEEVQQMQPSQANRKRLVLSRLLALFVFGRQVPVFRGFNLVRTARMAGPGANLKSFLGMVRRILIHRHQL